MYKAIFKFELCSSEEYFDNYLKELPEDEYEVSSSTYQRIITTDDALAFMLICNAYISSIKEC